MTARTPPRTLIDATAIPIDRRGVGRYIDEVVKALDHHMVIACQAHDEQQFRTLAPNALVLPQSGIRTPLARLLWEQFVLPRVAKRARVHVIHSPHYTIPLFTGLSRVVTFHDATFFSDPGVHTPIKRVFFRTWIRVSRWLADAVIVPSRATADELARYVRVGRKRSPYRVVHLGVDRSIFHPPAADEVRDFAEAFGLSDAPWITFLGTIEPRKNLPALIRAYALTVHSWSPAWGRLPTLVVAGGAGWGPSIDDEVSAVPAPGAVLRVGYVPLERLSALLGGALLVAYPSLGEGFGLPVLEAMSCGAPVLTTRRAAIPEVGGDAVRYSEPDAESLSEALCSLSRDPIERSELAAKGITRAEMFSWRACAEHHLNVYESVIAGSARAARSGSI